MKKIVILFAVALVGLTVLAQEARNEQRGRRGPNPEAMAQMMTKAMAQQYSLTPEQVQAVSALNLRFVGKIPMNAAAFMRPKGGQRPGPGEGQRPQGGQMRGQWPQMQGGHRPDSASGPRPQGGQMRGQWPQMQPGQRPGSGDGPRPQGGQMSGQWPQMQQPTLTKEQQKQQNADKKAYRKELKKIMDKTQFKAWKADQEEAEAARASMQEMWSNGARPGMGGPGMGGPGMGGGFGRGGFGGPDE